MPQHMTNRARSISELGAAEDPPHKLCSAQPTVEQYREAHSAGRDEAEYRAVLCMMKPSRCSLPTKLVGKKCTAEYGSAGVW
jgi:hypothetical protein